MCLPITVQFFQVLICRFSVHEIMRQGYVETVHLLVASSCWCALGSLEKDCRALSICSMTIKSTQTLLDFIISLQNCLFKSWREIVYFVILCRPFHLHYLCTFSSSRVSLIHVGPKWHSIENVLIIENYQAVDYINDQNVMKTF